jgi:hypothetical protein
MRTTKFLQARAARVAITALLLCMSASAAQAANQQTAVQYSHQRISILRVSATSLAFGSVDVSDSTTQSVTLTNFGNFAVTISNVTVAGAGFAATGISSGLILSGGQSATLKATFDPAAGGSATGSVTITSNARNSSIVIALSGTGVAPTTYSISLKWAASTSSVTGYNVYSGTVSGGPYTKLTSTPVAATNYTDSNVTDGTTYYFVVTAVNSDNQESAYSTQASASVP